MFSALFKIVDEMEDKPEAAVAAEIDVHIEVAENEQKEDEVAELEEKIEEEEEIAEEATELALRLSIYSKQMKSGLSRDSFAAMNYDGIIDRLLLATNKQVFAKEHLNVTVTKTEHVAIAQEAISDTLKQWKDAIIKFFKAAIIKMKEWGAKIKEVMNFTLSKLTATKAAVSSVGSKLNDAKTKKFVIDKMGDTLVPHESEMKRVLTADIGELGNVHIGDDPNDKAGLFVVDQEKKFKIETSGVLNNYMNLVDLALDKLKDANIESCIKQLETAAKKIESEISSINEFKDDEIKNLKESQKRYVDASAILKSHSKEIVSISKTLSYIGNLIVKGTKSESDAIVKR